jgi:hypothetical protein
MPDQKRPPRLLDSVRARIRVLRYAIRSGRAYSDWIKRYIRFIDKPNPRALSAAHGRVILSRLVCDSGQTVPFSGHDRFIVAPNQPPLSN